MKKVSLVLLLIVVFLVGWYSHSYVVIKNENKYRRAYSFYDSLPAEKPSPQDIVPEEKIKVYNDKVVLDISNAMWSTFTDTNSMDPVIDKGANAIEIKPKSESEIEVGDIVSYKSNLVDGIIIHRVVEIGRDEKGWFAIMKGDNNPYPDPEKVRFEQINGVVVGIIY